MRSSLSRRQKYEAYIGSRTEEPPPVLFKYRAVHDALRVLQGGALYWSPPSKFADHEDCKWNPFESLLNQDFEVVHRKVLSELLTGPIDWSRVRDRKSVV